MSGKREKRRYGWGHVSDDVVTTLTAATTLTCVQCGTVVYVRFFGEGSSYNGVTCSAQCLNGRFAGAIALLIPFGAPEAERKSAQDGNPVAEPEEFASASPRDPDSCRGIATHASRGGADDATRAGRPAVLPSQRDLASSLSQLSQTLRTWVWRYDRP